MYELNSAIFTGTVRHRRFQPMKHAFSYRLFMMYLDLDELPHVFGLNPFWSAYRPTLAWLRSADYLGASNIPLKEAVANLVKAELGDAPSGPIRVLTHLRYFGHCFNPVSFYYCFEADGKRLQSVVAEINNTPWNERCTYVLDCRGKAAENWLSFGFEKTFHVSPYMPMDVRYTWHFRFPGEQLVVHMSNYRGGEKIFDATLQLQRNPITTRRLNWTLLVYPFMTLQVVVGIYWQALRLWVKNCPIYDHPRIALGADSSSPHQELQ